MPSTPTSSKTKILFYIQNLSGGGAERCVFQLFKSLNKSNYEYKLLLGSVHGEYLSEFDSNDLLSEKYTTSTIFSYLGLLDRAITISLSLKIPLIPRILHRLRSQKTRSWVNKARNLIFSTNQNKQCEIILNGIINSNQFSRVRNSILNYNPDIIVSSLIETGSALFYLARQSITLQPKQFIWVAVEQNNTYDRFLQYYPEPEIQTFWHRFTKAIYSEADQVIAVSAGIKQGLSGIYGVSSNKIKVIHNPVDISAMDSFLPITWDKPFILAAGRLHPQKGFDFLIRTYASISDSINADLIILGQGKEQANLEQLAKQLGICDKVHLLGFKPNLWSYMKSAECFILSSRYEGFPLVLIEAMAAQCPVVAFDCKYGPSEIIQNMHNGILVPDSDISALAEGIKKVVTDKDLSLSLVEKASIKVKEFDKEKIVTEYESLFKSLIDYRYNHF